VPELNESTRPLDPLTRRPDGKRRLNAAPIATSTLAEFQSLQGRWRLYPIAQPEDYLGGSPDWRTDL